MEIVCGAASLEQAIEREFREFLVRGRESAAGFVKIHREGVKARNKYFSNFPVVRRGIVIRAGIGTVTVSHSLRAFAPSR